MWSCVCVCLCFTRVFRSNFRVLSLALWLLYNVHALVAWKHGEAAISQQMRSANETMCASPTTRLNPTKYRNNIGMDGKLWLARISYKSMKMKSECTRYKRAHTHTHTSTHTQPPHGNAKFSWKMFQCKHPAKAFIRCNNRGEKHSHSRTHTHTTSEFKSKRRMRTNNKLLAMKTILSQGFMRAMDLEKEHANRSFLFNH